MERIYLFTEDDAVTDDPRLINVNVGQKEELVKNRYNARNRFTWMTMTRCYFPSLLPQEDKVIYLDTDIVIRGSLQPLWDLDLTNYAFAATPDTKAMAYEPRPFISELQNYYSAGIMVMNLRYMREHGCENAMHKMLNNCTWSYPDQDVLNIVCDGAVLEMDPTYNSCLSTTIVANPIIQHGVPYKPWDPNSGELWRDWATLYLEHLNMTHPKS